ncbi:MAG: class I SAM-dependent methyltransferase [Verrucomicrobia bacterium]|nr:class I SAM-dependent methyltransferase [Verrucomicrobiota bacterium]
MLKRYRIQFPPAHEHDLGQDEAYFHLVEGDQQITLRFHDYDQIFKRPGLYEQLFYDRLKCTSQKKVCALLDQSLRAELMTCSELRVLDLGAGNGMMAGELRNLGVSRIVGADIIEEARVAAYRDRPNVYDDYTIADFTKLSPEEEADFAEWNFDCLTSVAALGFGDIPAEAFLQAIRLISPNGWVAFNIKETFLDRSDLSGFSVFIRELIASEYLDIHHLQLYTHRLSMEGVPLKYFAFIGRVVKQVPEDFLRALP